MEGLFEYANLKNFKSYSDVKFDITNKKGEAKKLAVIFGPNGYGKSNLASAFYMLQESLNTLNAKEIMDTILNSNDLDELPAEKIISMLKRNLKDIETLIKTYKMADTIEPMLLEFGFVINDKHGKYLLEIDNEEIIHEQLEFVLNKNRGTYFDITPNDMQLSNYIFEDTSVINNFKEVCEEYWGKHSFLSILLHEMNNKSKKFINTSFKFTENFNLFFDFIHSYSCHIRTATKNNDTFLSVNNKEDDYITISSSGTIDKEDISSLNKMEKIVNVIYKTIFDDIENIYYKRKEVKGKINYRLKVQKNIDNKIREIDFENESTGIKYLFNLIPFIVLSLKGNIVILDEFDMGLHDLLSFNLLNTLFSASKGQLIVTSHNTLLMETNSKYDIENKISKENIYIIYKDVSGIKKIKCVDEFNKKIAQTTNIKNQYLSGEYDSILSKNTYISTKLLENIKHLL